MYLWSKLFLIPRPYTKVSFPDTLKILGVGQNKFLSPRQIQDFMHLPGHLGTYEFVNRDFVIITSPITVSKIHHLYNLSHVWKVQNCNGPEVTPHITLKYYFISYSCTLNFSQNNMDNGTSCNTSLKKSY